MAREVELHDGRRLSLNPYALSWDDVTALIEAGRQDGPEYKRLVGKAFGLSGEEFGALPFPDASKLDRAVGDFLRNPVGADPN
jgi:hypothetical protein